MIKLYHIEEKISNYTIQIADALDRNDCISALKLRAVQKELQELCMYKEKQKETLSNLDFNKYYKTIDAALLLGINRSNLTKNPEKYEGVLTSSGYFFLKRKIDSLVLETKSRNKPGRKSIK